jgi:hypothetical protein
VTTLDAFDDYLGLAERPLGRFHAVTFHGRSGAGKSSALAFVRERHPQLGVGRGETDAVFDDLVSARSVPAIARTLASGRRVLAACHFHPRWLLPLRARWRIASFALDPLPVKVERWLAARGIDHSPEAVAAFCRRFGANYTDLGLVLEYAPDASFDRALTRFLRECRVEHTPRARR